jgi:peptidoglycan/xylan/chitin deacetylase (PgdA/CDA1 family)
VRIRNAALLRAIFALKGNFKAGRKPEPRVRDGIAIAPFRNNARAAVCISADFELSWAFRHHSKEVACDKGRQERENIPKLLKIFEEAHFPITWATVGHLFLEGCVRAPGGLAHPEMPRPPRNDLWTGDWYMHDPCTNYRRDPLWYAPDLIQRVIESPVGHEFGTHSFSHIDFSSACSDPILVRRELEESAIAMRRFGIRPRSLVYPFNRIGKTYLDLLAEFSITAVRHRDRHVRLSYPERTASGVYRLYESMNLRTAKHYDYPDKVNIFIAEAMKRHAAFHLWFHPSDPVAHSEGDLRRIVQYLDRQRNEGLAWIATMAELAAYCEARERLTPEVERTKSGMTIVWRGSFPSDRYGHTELSLVLPYFPSPSSIFVVNGDGPRHLDLGRSYFRSSMGQVLINMPTDAKSLHIVF